MKFDLLLKQLVPTLYEDDHLFIVAKPAGVDAGGMDRQKYPGLVEILIELRGRGESFEVANRLSRYESGILILGKNKDIVQHIRTGMKTNRIRQEYVAVVMGRMKKPHMTIGGGHGTSRGKIKKRSKKSTVKTDRSSAESTLSSTSLSLMKQGERRVMVRCQTSVATTHALRAQLRSARMRLLGDMLHTQSKRPASHENTCLHLSRFEFFHPHLKKKIFVQSKAPDSFGTFVDGKFDLIRPLHAALVKRLACLNTRDADAFRLLTGEREDIRGLVAEKFANVIILQNSDMHPSQSASIKDIARWYKNMFGVEAVYLWDRSKPKSRGDSSSSRAANGIKSRFVGSSRGHTGGDSSIKSSKPISQLVLGIHMPEEIAIKESGLTFGIKPGDGIAAGLFLDHRDNRLRVRSMSKGKDVLNLFAYTCGFSVAAAAGRARKTVSVDLSGKMLEWGKHNFKRNNLPLEPHQFFASDSFEFLKRARRQEMLFDIVILDPPSFAHGRKRKQDFSISRDLAELIAAAADVLRPKGIMMVSTNYRRMSIKGLRERIGKGARAAKRRHRVIETPKLPADFAIDPDHAKTIFVEFE